MKTIDCRRVCQEIEEANRLQLQELSLAAREHLESCVQCTVFLRQRLKLQEIVSSLGAVEAPADFDFQLRARLARGERHILRKIGGVSFSRFSLAVTMIGLLVGGGLLFRVFLRDNPKRPPENSQVSAAIRQDKNIAAEDISGKQAQSKQQKQTVASSQIVPPAGRTRATGKTLLANVRPKNTLATKDFSSLPAPVFRSDQSVASAVTFPIFPIGASYQSLKVSLDDGSGISRTISVPTVSFGSQRGLAGSPVTSTSKGIW